MRLLWRIILILFILIMAKSFWGEDQPQAYISSPHTKVLLKEIEWRADQIQKAAQDLPGSIEVMLRRIFTDGKPNAEAKSV